MNNNIEYYKRFKKEVIYLWNDEEEVFVKSVPGAKCYAKLKGGAEFEISPENEVVIRAMAAGKEVGRDEYNKA